MAFSTLPARKDGKPWQVAVRSDSAGYEQANLDHWRKQNWRFAVSADMIQQLREAIVALGPQAWQPWTQDADGTVREWAEVDYVPSRVPEQRDTKQRSAIWPSGCERNRVCSSATGRR